MLSPGHADNSVTVALGYGRRRTGRVGRNTGFDAYPLRTDKTTYFATGAKVTKTAETYQLVITQHHQAMEGRNLVRELPIDTYRKNAGFNFEGGTSPSWQMMGMDAHIPPNVSLYRNPPCDAQHQWGMAIDLNTCTGCNACVVACQAENNIPVVGKDQVGRGRAMHWIRIDRYYSTVEDNDPSHPEYDPTLADDPQILTQPVTCHHCENAPCETVCPVNATVHTEEGLNAMAYNRCIGTRYCSNNCPYKVRRFNFFNYNDRSNEPIESGIMAPAGRASRQAYLGPLGHERHGGEPQALQEPERDRADARRHGEVHVLRAAHRGSQDRRSSRSRAIRATRWCRAIRSRRRARRCARRGRSCSATWPTRKARFPRSRQQDRDYKMLEYLNVRPRLSYQARLRNPNLAMPGADLVGKTLLGNPATTPRRSVHEHTGPGEPHGESAEGGENHKA